MAKLKAPLLSLGASGAIGKALVYFGWKGLDVVREYVIPANPKSDDQKTQRGYLSVAVAAIHAVQAIDPHPLDADDLTAYSLYGSIFPTPRTWFNTLVKDIVDRAIASKDGNILCNGAVSSAVALKLTFSGQISGNPDMNGHLWYGPTKTALVHTVVANAATGAISVDIDPTVKGERYYMQWRADAGTTAEGLHSGIYHKVST